MLLTSEPELDMLNETKIRRNLSMKKSKNPPTLSGFGAWWRKNRLSCIVLLACVVLFFILRAAAATIDQPLPRGDDYAEYETAVVTDVLADNTEVDEVSDGAKRGEQLLLAEVKTGQYKGEVMQVYNYVGPLYGQTLKAGQRAVLVISPLFGLLSTMVGDMMDRGELSVSVLESHDQWFGMTYHEDVAAVKDSFKKMLENGVYKDDLFSDL